jgi:hypothetical protein
LFHVEHSRRIGNQPASVDGGVYSPAVEDELNQLAAGTFSQPPGRRFLDYLESITLRRALLPDASDAELRHLEGARWLVGVIRTRMALANRTRTS